MILRKRLASSSYAIAGTLESLIVRLEAMLESDSKLYGEIDIDEDFETADEYQSFEENPDDDSEVDLEDDDTLNDAEENPEPLTTHEREQIAHERIIPCFNFYFSAIGMGDKTRFIRSFIILSFPFLGIIK